MNKQLDILRLVLTSDMTLTHIAAATQVARNTVKRYKRIAQEQSLQWENITQMSASEIDAKFNHAPGRLISRRIPDFNLIAEELKKVGVTRQLLWEEYCEIEPTNALSYSQYSFHLREHQQKRNLAMRQTHFPGQAAFVDFSGKRPHYIDPASGEKVIVELFVGVLGYSNLTFAKALASQKVHDWVIANTEMLDFFQGVPQIVVPDNLKSAVIKAGREPLLNQTYRDLARHYSFAIIPARSYKPKDKAKVEGAVLIVQRWILARLRNLNFYSLAELNEEIRRLVDALNQRLFKKIPGCRRSRFEEQERAHMQSLPNDKYEFAEWLAPQSVPQDYHVVADHHWYSVPHNWVRKKVDIRIGALTVEIFHKGTRISAHMRSFVPGGHTTDMGHQPPNHRAYAERTPEKFKEWAHSVGVSTNELIEKLLDCKVPAMGLPACDGIKKLARQHGNVDIEAACQRALAINSPTLKSVRSLLSTGRIRKKLESIQETVSALPSHKNVRGADYFAIPGATTC